MTRRLKGLNPTGSDKFQFGGILQSWGVLFAHTGTECQNTDVLSFTMFRKRNDLKAPQSRSRWENRGGSTRRMIGMRKVNSICESLKPSLCLYNRAQLLIQHTNMGRLLLESERFSFYSGCVHLFMCALLFAVRGISQNSLPGQNMASWPAHGWNTSAGAYPNALHGLICLLTILRGEVTLKTMWYM